MPTRPMSESNPKPRSEGGASAPLRRIRRNPKRVNLVFESDEHADLIRYLGWRQNRDGIEMSMGRALMEALRESPLFREWQGSNPRRPESDR